MTLHQPISDDDRINAIRLYRSQGIGPQAFHSLIHTSESWSHIFEQVLAKQKHVGEDRLKLASQAEAELEFEHGQSIGAKFLMAGSDDYPKRLNDAPDRPPFLWALGQPELLEEPNIAIIGSRNPSLEGVRMTTHLAKLCNYSDIVVVSGLARGIDAAAHEAALSRGTIGVVAGGVDVRYPKSNAQLQDFMSEDGLVLSEQPFGKAPQARDFPKRNRIIAGLSHAVLVVEATERSGTKLTVNDARKYGRIIMAVPGHPFSGLAALPNQLIKEGALMVTDIDDILNEIAPEISLRSNLSKSNEQEHSQSTSFTPDHSAASDLGRAMIEGEGVMGLDGRFHNL